MEADKRGKRGFDRDTVIQIRRAWRYGHSVAEIARAWGISEESARKIVKGETYQRVIDDSPDRLPLPLPKPEADARRGRVVRGPEEEPANPSVNRHAERLGKERPQIPQGEKVVTQKRPIPRQ